MCYHVSDTGRTVSHFPRISADQVGFDQLTFGSTVEGPILPPVRGPGGGDVGASGDPHFKAWSGSYYDFMGACDLLLVHAPNFEEEAALDIVIRYVACTICLALLNVDNVVN